MAHDLIQLKPHGLVGPGEHFHEDFHIDAWSPAPINLITHAHSDHAREGSAEYWCTHETEKFLRHRLGPEIKVRSFAYGEKSKIGETWVSFHPAGHICGSAQVRVERNGQVWVVTGDYKRDPDPTCAPFEVVPCDVLITEATFALPIYNWTPMPIVAKEIYDWWQWCKTEKLTALLFAYSLGKAQRVLSELCAYTDEEVLLHGAVHHLTEIYRTQGIRLLPTRRLLRADEEAIAEKESLVGRLVIAPPSAHRSTWMASKRFKAVSTGFCSGWMAVRGIRRRRGYERGFVVSDHADWAALLRTVDESQAKRVLVTHGGTETLARYLSETRGIQAEALKTVYGEEEGE